MEDFLGDQVSRPWPTGDTEGAKVGLTDFRYFIQESGDEGSADRANELEVVVAKAGDQANLRKDALASIWNKRRGQRAAPVLLVVLHLDGQCTLVGHSSMEPVVHREVADHRQTETLCAAALQEPDSPSASRYLDEALPTMEAELPGINNQGLFALHELKNGVPLRADWGQAGQKAGNTHGKRGKELLKSLGFGVHRLDNMTEVLTGGEKKDEDRMALAVLLQRGESPDLSSQRFNNISPLSYALKRADDEGLDWVMTVQGNNLRLYSTGASGVGRRGRTQTYVGCQTGMLKQEHQPYLWLFYSADALRRDGSLHEILQSSERFAGELAKRLRERIYVSVVPLLAEGIAAARGLHNPSREDLDFTYNMALTVLFRALFIAYAEDRDLLPYQSSEAYRSHSLKRKAQRLAERANAGQEAGKSPGHSWQGFCELCEAVSKGHSDWGIPAYNGEMFSSEESGDPRFPNPGHALQSLILPDAVFEEAMHFLLTIDTAEDQYGPVDFRSLGVREFGTIYEGLLESELSQAETDLKIGAGGLYLPLDEGDGEELIEVGAGRIYLHNRSGARKASGSYYTPTFVVEHLLERSLVPALNAHFERLDAMSEAEAAEAFFDFRVADIAMGSGHFLIAAIDTMEKRMAAYLADHTLAGVVQKLDHLRTAAETALREAGIGDTQIEDGGLLRRLIARHCIFGVDNNRLAVQLTRLAVWLHTFVPGLPLSLLDHHLVFGNSLIGIGTMEEANEQLSEDLMELQRKDPGALLGLAKEPLRRLANINDANLSDLHEAQGAVQQVQEALLDTREFFSLLIARRLQGNEDLAFPLELEHFQRLRSERMGGSLSEGSQSLAKAMQRADQQLQDLAALHFPVAFPEVFLGDKKGFDALLGNPPWETMKVSEKVFWARYFPGWMGLSQSEREAKIGELRSFEQLSELLAKETVDTQAMRNILLQGDYPGLGTGDPDLYQAFSWRFWRLAAAEGGSVGMVLPSTLRNNTGSGLFRRDIYAGAAAIDWTVLENSRGWVFPEVDPRYSFALVAAEKGAPHGESITLSGPYTSLADLQQAHQSEGATAQSSSEPLCPMEKLSAEEVLSWGESAALPSLPPNSLGTFRQIARSPALSLDDGEAWHARPHTELHSFGDKDKMVFGEDSTNSQKLWPVYKGASFNLWKPEFGEPYAFAEPEPALSYLQGKRTGGRKGGPFGRFPASHLQDPATLPCQHPRLAYRRISRSTDPRTSIACLLPPQTFLVDAAPYLLWPRGDESDQAFLLGVLCSIPLDWYVRRWVEANITYGVFNSLRIPRPNRQDPRWQRVVALAGRLACPDERFQEWAKAVGVECGPLAADQKEDKIHELDALVAHLYGLSEEQLRLIFATFHRGWGYQPRMEAVLLHFGQIQ